MKIECGSEKLKTAISQVERITGKNLTLPILGSILFIASGKSLKLRAINLSLGIEIEIPAKVEKEGIVAISGSVVANIFSNFFDTENITLEEIDGNLLIKTKKSKIRSEER
ncbi:MAG: polymerase subunit beta, partial [Bacteroidota bacterium]|nr:polymerase subunit beta [Bacteroidota bacterium]